MQPRRLENHLFLGPEKWGQVPRGQEMICRTIPAQRSYRRFERVPFLIARQEPKSLRGHRGIVGEYQVAKGGNLARVKQCCQIRAAPILYLERKLVDEIVD